MIRREPGRWSVVTLVAAVLLVLAGTAPTSASPGSDCWVRNTSTGVTGSDLAGAIAEAAPGDKLRVRGTCNAPGFGFQFHRDVTLVGPGTLTARSCPGEDLSCLGQVVHVLAGNVKLKRLTITEGFSPTVGGLIHNEGNLVLNRTQVVGGIAEDGGGGIANDGVLKLNRTSLVRDNQVLFGVGGGILNHGRLILNAWTRVEGNAANLGGGVFSDGTVVLNRAATVTGNVAGDAGGGLLNDGGNVWFSKRWTGSLCGNSPDDWPGC